MQKPILPLLLVALLASCSTTQQDPTRPQGGQPANDGSPTAAEAQALLDQGKVDEALEITDAILKARPDDRAARIVAAKGNIAIFSEGRAQAQLFLEQAVIELERALDQDRNDPEALITLSWCKLRQSDFDAGRDLALEAAETLQRKGASAEEVANAFLQAADNQMQTFVDVRRGELAAGEERPSDDATAAANKVLTLLASAERAAPVAGAFRRRADLYQWMNRHKDAIEELDNGIRAHPTSNELHQRLQDYYWGRDAYAECVAAYRRFVDAKPGNTALLWYLGKAQVAHADKLRADSDWDAAARVYHQALASYQAYDDKRPSEHANTGQWLAICHLSLGRIAYEQGDLDEAIAQHEKAYEASKLVAEYDANGYPRVIIAGGGNYLGGLALIGSALSAAPEADALERTLAFFESILERHPGRFGSIYNNAALAARDLGTAIERAGREAKQGGDEATAEAKTAQAMELYERSYRYYEQAVQLSPEDPRIVNDCGLMLVYHLNQDYDRARQLFEKAVELGEEDLAQLPDDAMPAERRDIEEAVGDAYGNLGKLYAENLQEPEKAIPYLEKALEFFPYQERAARLRLQRIRSGETSPEQRQERARMARAFDAAMAKAQPKVDAGDYDGALLALDEVATELAEYAPFQFRYGQYSLRMAEQQAQAGGNVGLVDGLFQDAVRHLEKSVELDSDPLEPRLALARAQMATSDFAAAARTADELILHARSEGGAPEDFLREVHAVRGEAAARAYVAARQAPDQEADAALLDMARSSFREIRGSALMTDALLQLWVATEQWAEAPKAAIAVMVDAWRQDPSKLGALVDLGSQVGDSGAVVEALADVEDATSLWYRGRAGFDLGVQLWSSGEPEAAVRSLDAAIASFTASKEANPDFADSADQWRALCLGQRGLVQMSADQVDAAANSLLESARLRPDVAGNDLGGGSSVRRGLLIVGDRIYRGGDLAKAVDFFVDATEALPNDGQLQNNLGLIARDHGDALKRGGDAAAAEPFYEISYRAYTAASAAQPDDVRVRQDRALILVYCLERDFETAGELLQSAIDDGQRQLDESPPSDATERQNLEEAVGDAYMNLGYMQLQHTGELDKAEANLRKSLDYYPGENRASRGYLRMVQERRDG